MYNFLSCFIHCTYSAIKTGKQPIQGTTATHIWFYEKDLIAFATTLDWTGVEALYAGFSKSTCHYFGKVKDVIPKKESMVTAQGLFDQYVSNNSRACKVTVHAYIVPKCLLYMHIQPSQCI